MKTMYSVEIEAADWSDDTFTAETLEECREYCKEHDYPNAECGARIAKVLVDDDNKVVLECLGIYDIAE